MKLVKFGNTYVMMYFKFGVLTRSTHKNDVNLFVEWNELGRVHKKAK